MDITAILLTPVIGFLVTVIFGLWLSKVGRPYNGLLFNIHKLIALGTVIVTTIQVYQLLKIAEPQVLLVVLIMIAALCVVALFASGAFMSIGNLTYSVMKMIHNIAPVLAISAMGYMVYLLYR